MAIKVENIRHIYSENTPNEVLALNGIHLEINSGDFVLLIGPTGSGKSTLLLITAGLLKPTSGKIFIEGLDTSNSAIKEKIRKRTGVVFQYPERQFFKGNIFDEVMYGPKNFGINDLESNYRFAMNSVGLDPELFRNKSPFKLSGGEQRRLAIASSVSTNPSLLLMDEPTASLDESGIESLRNLLRKLSKAGITLIVSTHWPEYFYDLANKAIIMEEGRVRHYGRILEILQTDMSEELETYMGGEEMKLVRTFVKLKKRLPRNREELLELVSGRI